MCRVGVNECDSNPCQNGATCYDQYLDFHCQCTSDFTGHACDRRQSLTSINLPLSLLY